MGADRWSHCPNCNAVAIKKAAAARTRALESYGKVPLEKYLKLDKEANELRVASEESEETLREDWEIGIFGTEFSMSYSASCAVCQWEYQHRHKEEIKVQDGD